MRRLLYVATLLLVTGCASSLSHAPSARREVALTPGASDFATGDVRYPFLVVDRDGAAVERPSARVWLSHSPNGPAFQQRVAHLERIGVPGGDDASASHIYVAHFRIARPDKYWVRAEPKGGAPVEGLGTLLVRARTFSPALNSKGFASRTPTLGSVGGNASAITTRTPPDRALLRYSIASSLAAHKPFVVVFATPKFCTSRTCGPVVDVTDAVRQRLSRKGIRFIHVEIYKHNNPAMGFNSWVQQWHLPTEPWVFLVRADGTIAAKFEGPVSFGELAQAVRRYLA